LLTGTSISTTTLKLLDANKDAVSSSPKYGDLVYLLGHDPNRRDLDFAPTAGALFISQGTVDLLDWFWKNYEQYSEFCIDGSAGSGKSCAIQILAAEVARRLPSASVYHIRHWAPADASTISKEVITRAKGGVKTFLFVDQVVLDDDATTLGALAGIVNLWVVLTSSANLPHFRKDRLGSQHQKVLFPFPFQSPTADCVRLANLLSPDKYAPDVQLDFKPAESLKYDDAIRLPTLTTLDNICSWTNGHLLTLSQLISGNSTPAKIVATTVKAMTTYFQEDNDNRTAFYLALVQMFKLKETSIRLHSDMDERFMRKGKVLCPLFLQAYEECLLLGPSPAKFYAISHADLLIQNPSEVGFAVERECLQDENLLRAITPCIKLLGHDFPALPEEKSTEANVHRVGFRTVQQVTDEANRLSGSSAAWALHAIPLKWNEKSIDCIQIYFVDTKLFVIGNSISLQTAQDHFKSLAWIDELADMKAALTNFSDIHFILLFTAKQPDDMTVLRVPADRTTAVAARMGDVTVMDYPITGVMEPTSKAYFKLDPKMKDYSARRLSLEASKKRKATAGVCGCKGGCKTKKCGCQSASKKCSSACTCQSCHNKVSSLLLA
jgi:hypothetical protein